MGKQSLGVVGLLLVLIGAGACREKSKPPAGTHCDTVADCEAGELCTRDRCAACRTSDECMGSADYGGEFICLSGDCLTAASCPPGSDGCPCLLSGYCGPGFDCLDHLCAPACSIDQVRDGDGCRDAVGCEICDSRKRDCVTEDSGDATPQCGACLAEHREIEGITACELIPTCTVGDAGSIAELCDAQGRSCLPLEGGAECGDCLETHVLVGEACEVRVTCAELSCEDEDRFCEEEPNGHCAGCEDYFVEESGACRDVMTCASHPCADSEACSEATATSDRSCVESIGGCPAWQVPHRDGVSCVACPVPCNEVEGSSGSMVPEAFAGTQCVCETADGHFLSPGEDGGAVEIVACDADGDGWVRDTILGLEKYRNVNPEAAQLLLDNNKCTVRVVESIALRAEAGATVATDVLLEPVPLLESSRNDDDGELLALDSSDVDYLPSVGGTRQLRAAEINGLTKACLSTKADANHNGVPDIQESQENEDAAYISLLEGESAVGVAFKDYTYYLELYDGFFESAASTPDDGWTVGGGSLGGQSYRGTYIIQERSRARGAASATDVPGGVAMTYYAAAEEEVETPADNSSGNDHWRSCIRFEDADYEARRLANRPLHGLDFSKFSGSVVDPADAVTRDDVAPSLGHASQFKCMFIDDGTAGDPQFGYIYSQADANGFALNQCEAATAGTVNRNVHAGDDGDDPNPADPVLSCSRVASVGQQWVGWGAVKYDQAGNSNYKRGCANEFAFFSAGCPGFDPDAPHLIQGDGDIGNFGNLLCGCAPDLGGTSCEYGCPQATPPDPSHFGNHLFLHPRYREGASALFPVVNRPYWLCASLAASYMVGDPVFTSASGYSLEGNVSLSPATAPDGGSGTLSTPTTPSGTYSLTGGFTVLRGSPAPR